MLQIRTKIGAGGRVIIPASVRETLHWEIGEEVILSIKEDEVYMTTLQQALKKLQTIVKNRNTKKINLVHELLLARRQEASHE